MPGKSLRALALAGADGPSLVLFMLPPSGVLFVFILGSLSLYIGIGLAWAWGVITMKAALAARPSADTQARLAALQQAAATEAQSTGASVAGVAQRMIYDGWMLDTRVTAVVYCMLCVFIYLLVYAYPLRSCMFLHKILISSSRA